MLLRHRPRARRCRNSMNLFASSNLRLPRLSSLLFSFDHADDEAVTTLIYSSCGSRGFSSKGETMPLAQFVITGVLSALTLQESSMISSCATDDYVHVRNPRNTSHSERYPSASQATHLGVLVLVEEDVGDEGSQYLSVVLDDWIHPKNDCSQFHSPNCCFVNIWTLTVRPSEKQGKVGKQRHNWLMTTLT